MSEAKRDENRIATLLGALDSDGITPKTIYSSPTRHTILCVDDTTGSDHSITDAVRDENRIPVALVMGSDGVTLTELYADSSHNLLIQST